MPCAKPNDGSLPPTLSQRMEHDDDDDDDDDDPAIGAGRFASPYNAFTRHEHTRHDHDD